MSGAVLLRFDRVEARAAIAEVARFSPLVTRARGDRIDADLLSRAPRPEPFVLERGETLGSVLPRFGLSSEEAQRAVEALSPHIDPRRLRAGEVYSALWTDEDRLAGFRFTLAKQGVVALEHDDDHWSSRWLPYSRESTVRQVEGRLESTLEGALRSLGGDPEVAYLAADVLQWDLDFTRDLRTGDRFRILYRELLLDGRPSGPQEIVAVQYENRGRTVEAYRFGDGYYDGEGRPTQKMFLRSPLRYNRISSRFSQRRFHPVLKSYRPHYGVDYAAPTGTPVRVTANGVIDFAGWNGGGGRMIKVRHPNGYLTAYLHLSGFASGVTVGRRVEQGEVIGYVGATGLASGPHLDYRIQVNGHWIDPLSIESVPSPPIPDEELDRFIVVRDELRAELSGLPDPGQAVAYQPGTTTVAGPRPG